MSKSKRIEWEQKIEETKQRKRDAKINAKE